MMKLDPLELTVIEGEPYEKVNTDPNWLRVGYIPKPRTRFGWFVYNMAHGIAMRYPLWNVVKFSLSKGASSGFSVTVEVDKPTVWDFVYLDGSGTKTEL